MLDIDYVEQLHLKKYVQNSLKDKLEKIGLDEAQFVQNHNSPNVNKVEPFSIILNSIPQIIHIMLYNWKLRCLKSLHHHKKCMY